MFSSAFGSAFRIVTKQGFSGTFAAPFRYVGYIGPVSGQAALIAGAESWAQGSALVIEGKKLIGPAGKVYAFASMQSMEIWRDNAIASGVRQAAIIAALSADKAAAWKAKKRAKLAIVAGRVVNAAAVQKDRGKRAALLAESNYCLSKWQ